MSRARHNEKDEKDEKDYIWVKRPEITDTTIVTKAQTYPTNARELFNFFVSSKSNPSTMLPAKQQPNEKSDAKQNINERRLGAEDINLALQTIKKDCAQRFKVAEEKDYFGVWKTPEVQLIALNVTKDFKENSSDPASYHNVSMLSTVLQRCKEKTGIFLAPMIQVGRGHVTLCMFDFQLKELFIVDSQGFKALANLGMNIALSASASILTALGANCTFACYSSLAAELGLSFSSSNYACLGTQAGTLACGMYVLKWMEEILLGQERHQLHEITFSRACTTSFSRNSLVNPPDKDELLKAYNVSYVEEAADADEDEDGIYSSTGPIQFRFNYFQHHQQVSSDDADKYFSELVQLADAIQEPIASPSPT